VVDEGALAVDLDDGQELAKAPLQLGIAADVDLLEVERDLRADGVDRRPRALAEVAAARGVEREPGDRAG
jgi:hypothetical protein